MRKSITTLVLSLTAMTPLLAGKDVVVELNEKKFPAFIAQDSVAVQFYAQWDEKRKESAGQFESFCREQPALACARVNVDQYADLAKSNATILGTPNTVFYQSGSEIGRLNGRSSQEELEKKFDDLY